MASLLKVGHFSRSLSLNRFAVNLIIATASDSNVRLQIQPASSSLPSLREELQKSPADCTSQRYLWQVSVLMGKSHQIDPHCENRLTKDIMSTWALRLGQHYSTVGNFRGAAFVYKKGLKLGKTRAQSWLFFELSNAQYQLEMYDKSLENAIRALDTTDNSHVLSRSNFRIGTLLRRMAKPDEAIPYILSSVELEPDRVWNHLALGNAYKEIGQVEAARSAYRNALGLEPVQDAAIRRLIESLDNP